MYRKSKDSKSRSDEDDVVYDEESSDGIEKDLKLLNDIVNYMDSCSSRLSFYLASHSKDESSEVYAAAEMNEVPADSTVGNLKAESRRVSRIPTGRLMDHNSNSLTHSNLTWSDYEVMNDYERGQLLERAISQLQAERPK
jgi:hypothetical protein